MRDDCRRPVRLTARYVIASGVAAPLFAICALVPAMAIPSLAKDAPLLTANLPAGPAAPANARVKTHTKAHPRTHPKPHPKAQAKTAAKTAAPFKATPATAEKSQAPRGLCSSDSDEAGVLDHDLSRVLASRRGTVSVALTDLDTGVSCGSHTGRHFDSASVIKATILATLLHQAQVRGRWLSGRENALAVSMITHSDNDAASALWREVGGHSGVQRFLAAAGMNQTTAGYGSAWGLSQITAADQLKLLNLLVNDNAVLTGHSRAYQLGLMRRVEDDQRWGVPSGVPDEDLAANKNGWLPRATLGWRVHSIGAVTGEHSYLVAILSDNNPSMGYGVATLNRVASVINHDVNDD